MVTAAALHALELHRLFRWRISAVLISQSDHRVWNKVLQLQLILTTSMTWTQTLNFSKRLTSACDDNRCWRWQPSVIQRRVVSLL
jgi:hypothetical protein